VLPQVVLDSPKRRGGQMVILMEGRAKQLRRCTGPTRRWRSAVCDWQ
jgi:hypothetical protein